jgi:hypothetical protein
MKILVSETQMRNIIKNYVNNSLNESQINESKQTEEMALSILRSKNVDDPDKILNKLKSIDKTKNEVLLPTMAFLFDENVDLYLPFEKMVKLVSRGMMKPELRRDGVYIEDKKFTEPLRFSEFIDYTYERKLETTKISKDEVSAEKTKDTPLFNENGIEIYDANDRGRCIRYTQGGLTGKAYSFCIGQFTHNQFYTYRGSQDSTFYFVVDKNRDFENDPLHIVVVDHNRNGYLLTDATNKTGEIAEYGEDEQGYLEYLESKGVDTEDIFKYKPKTEEEKEEDRLIGKENKSLEYFIKLPYQLKSKYIGRGHQLTDDQFDYLWFDRNTKSFEELLTQYFGTGYPLNEYQFNKMVEEG